VYTCSFVFYYFEKLNLKQKKNESKHDSQLYAFVFVMM